MPTNGMISESARGAQPVQPAKRRTTITAPATGTWALGKTIGAGSMGKVKLAKHNETGEQVCVASWHVHSLVENSRIVDLC